MSSLKGISKRFLENILLVTGLFPERALLPCLSRMISGRRLFEGTGLAQWPLKCPAEADKRSQVQWKNSHVITTRGRYGVSHYCQDSVPAANSSANNYIALLYGDKWSKTLWTEWELFNVVIWVTSIFVLKMEGLFLAYCSFSAVTNYA